MSKSYKVTNLEPVFDTSSHGLDLELSRVEFGRADLKTQSWRLGFGALSIALDRKQMKDLADAIISELDIGWRTYNNEQRENNVG